jgi:hypothetical protein
MSEIQIKMSLDWGSEKPDTQMANAVQIQRFGKDVILSLGIALTPFALTGMSHEEITEYLKTNNVPVHQVRRVVLPLPVAHELAKQIMANLPVVPTDDEEQFGGPAESDQEAS